MAKVTPESFAFVLVFASVMLYGSIYFASGETMLIVTLLVTLLFGIVSILTYFITLGRHK